MKEISEFHAKKLGYIQPINWLMKIAENLKDFRNKLGVISEIEIQNPKTGETRLLKALWDTGATYTCISKTIVEDMKLTQVGVYNLTTPLCTTSLPNYDITLKIHSEKTAHYQIKAGVFEGNNNFDVILGLDMLLQGKLTMWVENGVFNFEFIENIDNK